MMASKSLTGSVFSKDSDLGCLLKLRQDVGNNIITSTI